MRAGVRNCVTILSAYGSFVLKSFFHVRNAIICPRPVSSGNISHVRNYGVVPRKVNLKHGQRLWPTQGFLVGLAVPVDLLVFTFIFKN